MTPLQCLGPSVRMSFLKVLPEQSSLLGIDTWLVQHDAPHFCAPSVPDRQFSSYQHMMWQVIAWTHIELPLHTRQG